MASNSCLAFLVTSSVIAAGCVGAGGAGLQGEPSALPDELGVVKGLVLSEEWFPVADALVLVLDGPSTTTDAEGGFELRDVPPGPQTLNITKDGYEPLTHEIDLRAGEELEVRLALKGLPGEAPYMTTIPYEGFSSCQISAVYSAGPYNLGPLGCPFGVRKVLLKVEVGPDWAAGVHEMTWRTSEEMIFASTVSTTERPQPASCVTSGSTHTWCPALVWGKSPLRIVARPMDPAYAKKYAIDGKEMWPTGNYTSNIFSSYSGFFRGEINNTLYPACVVVNRQFNVPENWGCPFGVGTSLGIRFQFYHTTFYLVAPLEPERFSAMPDR